MSQQVSSKTTAHLTQSKCRSRPRTHTTPSAPNRTCPIQSRASAASLCGFAAGRQGLEVIWKPRLHARYSRQRLVCPSSSRICLSLCDDTQSPSVTLRSQRCLASTPGWAPQASWSRCPSHPLVSSSAPPLKNSFDFEVLLLLLIVA